MIGNMLARFCNETQAEDALRDLDEPALMAALRRRAEAQGVALGVYTAHAVRHYMDAAPEEEWLTLLGELRRSSDPARAFARRALARVAEDRA